MLQQDDANRARRGPGSDRTLGTQSSKEVGSWVNTSPSRSTERNGS